MTSTAESSTPAVLYRCIVADPPWPLKYHGAGWRDGGTFKRTRSYTGKIGLGYDSLSVDEIADLPVGDLTEPNAHLYLWIPDAFLIAGHGERVVRAWGFQPARLLVWHKRNFGLGTFPRPQHESVITAKRGSLPYLVNDVGSVHNWRVSYDPRVGKRHSEKPEGFLDLVERASPGPYLELFARRNRLGWDTWGNESLEHVPLLKGTSSDLGSNSASTGGSSRSSRPGASPFQEVTDDLTDGCGCACHTGTGYRSSCEHCGDLVDALRSVRERTNW